MKCETFIDLVRQHIGVPSSLYDLGAFDGEQTIELASAFPSANVTAFECDSDAYAKCLNRCKDNPRIRTIPVALNNAPYDIVPFYRAIAGNKQYGSLLYPKGNFLDPMLHSEDSVAAMRLSDAISGFRLEPPNAIWMDIQGGESDAIRGLGDGIVNVKIIASEINYSETYVNQMLHFAFNDFMLSLGFTKIREDVEAEDWFGTAYYLNSRCTHHT